MLIDNNVAASASNGDTGSSDLAVWRTLRQQRRNLCAGHQRPGMARRDGFPVQGSLLQGWPGKKPANPGIRDSAPRLGGTDDPIHHRYGETMLKSETPSIPRHDSVHARSSMSEYRHHLRIDLKDGGRRGSGAWLACYRPIGGRHHRPGETAENYVFDTRHQRRGRPGKRRQSIHLYRIGAKSSIKIKDKPYSVAGISTNGFIAGKWYRNR